MTKMFAPEGSSGLTGVKREKDGSYDVPESQVQEMRLVHGFRLTTEQAPLTPDQMDAQVELRRREQDASAERITVLNAEVNTLRTANERLTRENQNLTAKLRQASVK